MAVFGGCTTALPPSGKVVNYRTECSTTGNGNNAAVTGLQKQFEGGRSVVGTRDFGGL